MWVCVCVRVRVSVLSVKLMQYKLRVHITYDWRQICTTVCAHLYTLSTPLCVCVCVCVRARVCVCVCVCVHIQVPPSPSSPPRKVHVASSIQISFVYAHIHTYIHTILVCMNRVHLATFEDHQDCVSLRSETCQTAVYSNLYISGSFLNHSPGPLSERSGNRTKTFIVFRAKIQQVNDRLCRGQRFKLHLR